MQVTTCWTVYLILTLLWGQWPRMLKHPFNSDCRDLNTEVTTAILSWHCLRFLGLLPWWLGRGQVPIKPIRAQLSVLWISTLYNKVEPKWLFVFRLEMSKPADEASTTNRLNSLSVLGHNNRVVFSDVSCLRHHGSSTCFGFLLPRKQSYLTYFERSFIVWRTCVSRGRHCENKLWTKEAESLTFDLLFNTDTCGVTGNDEWAVIGKLAACVNQCYISVTSDLCISSRLSSSYFGLIEGHSD